MLVSDQVSQGRVIDLPDALQKLPDEWQCTPIDLTAQDAEDRLSEAATEQGAVDILVANAGAVPP